MRTAIVRHRGLSLLPPLRQFRPGACHSSQARSSVIGNSGAGENFSVAVWLAGEWLVMRLRPVDLKDALRKSAGQSAKVLPFKKRNKNGEKAAKKKGAKNGEKKRAKRRL